MEPLALDSANINYLRKEILPFGGAGASYLRLSGISVIDNPDPVLRFMAQRDESAYRTLETDLVIASSRNHRINTLLAAGSQVVVGSSNTADAKNLRDFSVAFLKQIPRFVDVQRKIMDAMFWGWRPLERLWEPFEWNGAPRWGVSYVYEKFPEHFRFTTDRNLVFLSPETYKPVLFDLEQPENRMRWMTPSYGSLNNPYGEGIDQNAWLVWYTKNRFVEMWARGMGRSMGVLKATESNNGNILSNRTVKPADAMAQIASELSGVLEVLNKNGILVQRAGWLIEMLSDVSFSDGWLGGIQYLDDQLRTYIATESLSFTEAKFGTRAQSQTHREVGVDDTGRVDAKWLEGVVNDQLIAVAIAANFGRVDGEDMPKWRSKLSAPIDADMLAFLFDAGAPLDGDTLAAEGNVPLATPESKLVIQKSQGPTPAQIQAALAGAPQQGTMPGDPLAGDPVPPEPPPS